MQNEAYRSALWHRLIGRRPDQWTGLLFWTALCISLIPLWSNMYFLTGDGPTHLYNAKVLLDYLRPDYAAFYNTYYELNLQANPNWLTHIVMAALLSFLPGFMAEKIFLTAYVVGFALVLRWLIRKINPENEFLVLLGLPLVYVFPLQMGFFNYLLSIVVFFVCIIAFMSYRQNFTWGRVAGFAILNLTLYFTHPIGWLLCIGTIGLLMLFDYRAKFSKGVDRERRKSFVMLHAKLAVAFAPAILMLMQYLSRRGTEMSANPYTFKALFYDLIEMRSLIVMSLMEVVWALWIALIFGVLLLYAVWTKIKARRVVWTDAFFVLFVLSVIVYFFQPGGMAGAGILKERLSFLPYVLCLPWLASIAYHRRLRWFMSAAAFLLGALLIFARLPIYREASRAVTEILSVRDSIHDQSTVLPLSFYHSGKKQNGERISNRIWLFMHAADYLGVEKRLIMLGNYEAHTGHFPIRWREGLNPFELLSASNEGIEAQPPSVNIEAFRNQTGRDVNYVLITFLDKEFGRSPETLALMQELQANYIEVDMQTSWRVRLYRRNGIPIGN